MDVRRHNREAWNRYVAKGNRWTVPVSSEAVARAAQGDFEVILTPVRPVPAEWFPPLAGLRVLALASGGGQQGPLLAAAGAEVTVLDNAPNQLAQDRMVAERDGLDLRLVEGDMCDLSGFADASFDLVFNPCSNGFVEDVRAVFREAFRVLVPGGTFLSGHSNPVIFLFDLELEKKGVFTLRYEMPFSDLKSLPEEHLKSLQEDDEPLMFGHSLEDLIGGQTAAGFHVTGFFDDDWGGKEPIDRHLKGYFATRSVKPRREG